MSFLVTIETHNLTHVLLVPSFLVSELICINSGGRDGGIFGFSGILRFFRISFVSVVLFPFILLGFIRRLGILSGSGHRALRRLEVIPTMIFHHSLGLDFVRGVMGWSIPLKTTRISFLHIRTRA